MQEKRHRQPPSHYNQPTTVTKVVHHSHSGHPGAVVTQTAPMGIPQYNPNHFFPMQKPTNLHSHDHAPHIHVHNPGHMHGHK
ncbi:hypothetical protein [uncultured Legionella sp.]|uniref:hypothetical protein n=1 Tax=uncultured Legionella sp. TaxID=210934 RepID=UPI0026182CD7|nr:hypothetical protein [uncultured Legionella sp.]